MPGLSYELAAEKARAAVGVHPAVAAALYASTALAHGIPITEVSRWLRHKSIQVMHQIYGYLVPHLLGPRSHLDDARRAGRRQPPHPQTVS